MALALLQLIISTILLSSIGLIKVVAVAVHFKGVDMVGKAVDKNSSQLGTSSTAFPMAKFI